MIEHTKQLKFPSPVGVFFISSNINRYQQIETFMVSVPCRGLFYFIHGEAHLDKKDAFKRFRPLSGSFLFHQTLLYTSQIPTKTFPSPVGVFFISSSIGLNIRGEFIEFPSPVGVFFISSCTII